MPTWLKDPQLCIAFVGFLSAIIASEVVAFVTAGFNDQFAFLVWTVPFASAVGGTTYSLNRFFAHAPVRSYDLLSRCSLVPR